MPKPASYPPPNYHDPSDLRLVQIVKAAERAQPRSVNIIGVPFDGAVLGRKGAAGGPEAIRQALTGFSNYNYELGVGLEDSRVFDIGDVVAPSSEVAEVHPLVESEVARAVDSSSLLVVLGGDNSLTLPALAACSKRFRKLGLIVIDTHLDLRGEIGGKPSSGSSYGLAIGKGLVNPRNVAEIGIHGFHNSKVYVERAKKLGVTLFSADEVERRGARAVARAAYSLASKGAGAVYLSVDMDAVDISQVSGVSAPSAGGISARDLFALVHEIAMGERVKCADIVELAPSLDATGMSQRVAAAALVYLMAGYHSRRQGRPEKK